MGTDRRPVPNVLRRGSNGTPSSACDERDPTACDLPRARDVPGTANGDCGSVITDALVVPRSTNWLRPLRWSAASTTGSERLATDGFALPAGTVTFLLTYEGASNLLHRRSVQTGSHAAVRARRRAWAVGAEGDGFPCRWHEPRLGRPQDHTCTYRSALVGNGCGGFATRRRECWLMPA